MYFQFSRRWDLPYYSLKLVRLWWSRSFSGISMKNYSVRPLKSRVWRGFSRVSLKPDFLLRYVWELCHKNSILCNTPNTVDLLYKHCHSNQNPQVCSLFDLSMELKMINCHWNDRCKQWIYYFSAHLPPNGELVNGAIDINRKLQDVQKDKQKLGMWLHIANNVILNYQLSSRVYLPVYVDYLTHRNWNHFWNQRHFLYCITPLNRLRFCRWLDSFIVHSDSHVSLLLISSNLNLGQ